MSSIVGRSSVLITGLEGSGKSHFVMSQIKQILDNPDNNTQIFLANVDGVTLIDPDFRVVEPEFSWVNDAPINSIVIYDEAGTIDRFNNSKTKINSHIDVETLTMRRHKNVLTIFVTQDPKLVHAGLRSLIKFHFHFSNPYSSATETKCFVTAGVNDGHPKKTIIEEFDHKLDPAIFPLYKSVDEGVKHDQKPTKHKKAQLMQRIAILSMLLAIPAFIGMFYLINKVKNEQFDADKVNEKVNGTVTDKAKEFSNKANPTTGMNTAGETNLQQNNQDAIRSLQLYEERLAQDYRVTANNEEIRVSGVVMMRGECQAYNAYGEFLRISQSECKAYTDNVGVMQKANRNGQRITTENRSNNQKANNQNTSIAEQNKNTGSNEVIANPAPLPNNQASNNDVVANPFQANESMDSQQKQIS